MTNGLGTVLKFSVNVTVAAVVILAGTALCLLYIFVPDLRAELTFTAAIVGGMAVVYSSYYAAHGTK